MFGIFVYISNNEWKVFPELVCKCWRFKHPGTTDILPKCNWHNSQIPQFTWSISHNVPFRMEICMFLFWMVHCGIFNRCIVGIVRCVYPLPPTTPPTPTTTIKGSDCGSRNWARIWNMGFAQIAWLTNLTSASLKHQMWKSFVYTHKMQFSHMWQLVSDDANADLEQSTELRVSITHSADDAHAWCHSINSMVIQWNLSVTTTSIINLITCDLFSNVF